MKVKLAEQFSDIDSSDVDNSSRKNRHVRAKKCIESEEDDECTLPPPPKKPVLKTSQKQEIKKHFTVASASKDDNNSEIFFADIDFKKELLRRWNKIDAKLDRIDGRLNSLEEKLESAAFHGTNSKSKEYFDIEEIVSFPLKTKEALDNLELDLQDADFFKNMINFMKHLGGKTYHEMTFIILKYTISNFLSTLYCWNGKEGKKAAFKDTLLAKCIKQCVKSKFDQTDQQIVQTISKWFIQGKLRYDRDEERLQRCKPKSQKDL